jgi:hypothetical protein
MGGSPGLPPDANTLIWTRPSRAGPGPADAAATDAGAADREATAASRPRILVFGHSHMGALQVAYAAEAAGGSAGGELVFYQFLREGRPHIILHDGKWQYHPDCRRELLDLIRATQPRLMVSMLQGEQAVLAGLVVPQLPFDFYLPEEEAATSTVAEIIPYDVLLECCKFDYRLICDLVDEVRTATAQPVIALSPPPPIGDRDFILANNLRHANIGEHIKQHGLPTTRWRRRLWQVHTEAIRSIYRERGIAFADPPAETCGADGCLLQPFWSDAIHANEAYGRLLLRQIRSLATSGC